MIKKVRQEKGGTLLIVFCFIVVTFLIVVPLVEASNIGLLQAKTGQEKESAFVDAHSAMTIFAYLHEEQKSIVGESVKEEYVDHLVQEVGRVLVLNDLGNVTVQRSKVHKNRVEFIATSATNSKYARTSKLEYRVKLPEPPTPTPKTEPTPIPESPTPTPTSTPTETATNTPVPTLPPQPTPTPVPGKGIIMVKANTANEADYNKHNKLFAACPAGVDFGKEPVQYPLDKINNTFTDAEFDQIFNPTKTTLINQADALVKAGTAGYFPSVELAIIKEIDRTISEPDYIVTSTEQTVFNQKKGNVLVKFTNGNERTLSFSSNTENGRMQISGNLDISEALDSRHLTFKDPVFIGGDLKLSRVQNSASITFEKGVYVAGNIDLGYGGSLQSADLLFKGDVFVGGDFKVKDSSTGAKSLNMDGKLVVGKDLLVKAVTQTYQISGSAIIGGNATIESIHNGGSLVFAQGLVTAGDLQLAKGKMITGKFISGNKLAVGGNMDLGGFNGNSVFHIKGDWTVAGRLSMSEHINTPIQVDGNLATGTDFIFSKLNGSGSLKIGGSLLSKGKIHLAEGNVDSSLSIAGNVLAGGDFTFGYTINGNGAFTVGGALLVGGDLAFKNHVNGKVVIKGNFVVYGDADFLPSSDNMKWQNVRTGGFAVKGKTNMLDQNNNKRVCVSYTG